MTDSETVAHMADGVAQGGHGTTFSLKNDALVATYHDRDHEVNQGLLWHIHEERT